MNQPFFPSRRQFLHKLGAAAALPWLGLSGTRAAPRGTRAEAGVLTVLNCNIRVPLEEDVAVGNGWAARRDLCAAVMRSRSPGVICMQEVLREPLMDLRQRLPGYDAFGFEGPEMDARPTGYHGIAKNVMLYSREQYELVSAGGFWLSETPHLPGSLSWDSARARHVNWVRLRDRVAGTEFRVLTTHLDHLGQTARERQMGLVLDEAAAYPENFPQILAGDLNADATNPVLGQTESAGWTDAYAAIHGPAGDGPTYHGFHGNDYVERTSENRRKGRIDFILVRGAARPLAAEIVRDGRGDRFPSDHYFLRADLALG